MSRDGKFDRNYVLKIAMREGLDIEIRRPFTLEFEVIRTSLISNNIGSFRIYNLHPNNRNRIRKDAVATWDRGRTVQFRAGYGTNLSLAFTGLIDTAFSTREGVDVITQIECFDGGFSTLNNVLNNLSPFPAGTPMRSVIEGLAKQMPDISIGAIGRSFTHTPLGEEYRLPRGNSFTGQVMRQISELVGKAAFIDNGKLYCLGDKECIDTGTPPIVSAKTGLLGTPTRQGQYVNFDMLFEPALRVGQLIRMDSTTTDNPNDRFAVNGLQLVKSIRHSGTISDSVSGSVVTSISALSGVFSPQKEG